jgi:hypothetical protein
MKRTMWTVKETVEAINNGEKLLIAGDGPLLSNLPLGQWIGGTIPYVLEGEGGHVEREILHVSVMPGYADDVSLVTYDAVGLEEVYLDAPYNGFSLIIIPAMSEAHLSFALNAPGYRDFALRPLIGWISGVPVEDIGLVQPRVYAGPTGESMTDKAVVMHVSLPRAKTAEVEVVNNFKPGSGETVVFYETGFSVREAIIGGRKRNLAHYLDEISADTRLPLVADYHGAFINTSFQSVDPDSGIVYFYAPVFKGFEYRHAAPVSDYVGKFRPLTPVREENVLFSCSCILNYLDSRLEGRRMGSFTDPIVFGEIAHQLMNQTRVYLRINDA